MTLSTLPIPSSAAAKTARPSPLTSPISHPLPLLFRWGWSRTPVILLCEPRPALGPRGGPSSQGSAMIARVAGEDDELEVTSPKRSSAGLPAVVSSLRHGLKEMGPVRTARTLALIN